MKIFKGKQTVEEDPSKPMETPVDQPVDTHSVDIQPAPTVSINEDRSAYNCPDCKGSGLVWHEGAKRDERCTTCQGTGKVS